MKMVFAPYQTKNVIAMQAPTSRKMRRPLLLTILGLAVILITTIIHFHNLYSPSLSLVDPSHRHFDSDHLKACTEKNDCPTLDKWLYEEAEVGHDNAVKALLKAGADGNARVSDGLSALHIAVTKGHEKVVKVLLKAGVDVNTPTIDQNRYYFSPPADGWTALHIAAITGNEKMVKLLLTYGADTTAKSVEGAVPLHRAAEFGYDKIVKILLKAGAEVDARALMGDTPLLCASSEGHVEVIKVLLAAGADVNAEMLDGRTPLWVAVNRGESMRLRYCSLPEPM